MKKNAIHRNLLSVLFYCLFLGIHAEEGSIEIFNRSATNIATIGISTNIRGNANMQLIHNAVLPLKHSHTKFYYELNSPGYIELNRTQANKPIPLFLMPGDRLAITILDDRIEVKGAHREMIEYFYNDSDFFYITEFETIIQSGINAKQCITQFEKMYQKEIEQYTVWLKEDKISQAYFDLISRSAQMHLLSQIHFFYENHKVRDGLQKVAVHFLKQFDPFDMQFENTRIGDWCNAIALKCVVINEGVLEKTKKTKLKLWNKLQQYLDYAPKEAQRYLGVYAIQNVSAFSPSEIPYYEEFYKKLKKAFPNDRYVRYFQKYFLN